MSSRIVAHHFDFHGIFRLTVQTDAEKARRHFLAEYGIFETTPLEQPDLLVSVGSDTLDGSPALVSSVDRSHQNNREPWVQVRERHKVATWQFALRGLNRPTTQLRFAGGFFSLDYLQHYVEQIMRFKISRQGYLLVHGGCVARAGASVLFPGRGHAGKTALALQQVLAGRQFQSDDYTFLSSGGETYSYPRRLHISEHIDAVCPAALRQVSLSHKASIKAKSFIYHLTLKYGDLSEPLQLAEMIPNAPVADAATLHAVLLLRGVEGTEVRGPVSLDQAEAIDQIMEINRFEAKRFQRVLSLPEMSEVVGCPDSWHDRERNVLQEAVSGIPSYAVDVPRNAASPEGVLEQLGRIVDQVLG